MIPIFIFGSFFICLSILSINGAIISDCILYLIKYIKIDNRESSKSSRKHSSSSSIWEASSQEGYYPSSTISSLHGYSDSSYSINEEQKDDLTLSESKSSKSSKTKSSISSGSSKSFIINNQERKDEIKRNLLHLPMEIIETILIYEHEQSLDDLYERVMNEISKILPPDYKRKNPNFYNDDFSNSLLNLILLTFKEEKKKSFSLSNSFYHDLIRLLFKWTIYMKQERKMDNKVITEKVKSIISLIKSRIGLIFPLFFNLELIKSRSELVLLKTLMNCEFLENPSIFPLFSSAVDDFYNRASTRGDCEKLKFNYFNGDFEKNLLLKFIILMYDPQGEMRKCFPGNDHLKFPTYRQPLKTTFKYLENLREKGPEDLAIFEIRFMSTVIIEFFLNTDKKFLIILSEDLMNFIKMLKDRDLLKRRHLNKIIEFEFRFDDIYHYAWDDQKFNNILKNELKNGDITESEYVEYLKLIEWK